MEPQLPPGSATRSALLSSLLDLHFVLSLSARKQRLRTWVLTGPSIDSTLDFPVANGQGVVGH